MKIGGELALIAQLLERMSRSLESYASDGDRKAVLFRDAIVRRLVEVRGLLGSQATPEQVMSFLSDPLPNPVDFDAVGLQLADYGEAEALYERIAAHAASLADHYID